MLRQCYEKSNNKSSAENIYKQFKLLIFKGNCEQQAPKNEGFSFKYLIT